MIFKNPKDIPGNTSVFPAVSWSRYPYFQGAVVMQGVRVSIQSAGPAIFEPEAQRGHVKKKKWKTHFPLFEVHVLTKLCLGWAIQRMSSPTSPGGFG